MKQYTSYISKPAIFKTLILIAVLSITFFAGLQVIETSANEKSYTRSLPYVDPEIPLIVQVIQYGDSQDIEAMMIDGYDPNEQLGDPFKPTPIWWAISTRDKDKIKALLDAGADLSIKEPGGNTAIVEAAITGNYPSVYYLLQQVAVTEYEKIDVPKLVKYMEKGYRGKKTSTAHQYLEKTYHLLKDNGVDITELALKKRSKR